MPKTKKKASPTKTNDRAAPAAVGVGNGVLAAGAGPALVVSMGCPSGIGPEVVVAACARRGSPRTVVVGDRATLASAARALGLSASWVDKVPDYSASAASARVQILATSQLEAAERRPGKPSPAGGRAQLEYIEEGYRLAKTLGVPLVTGPVSKHAIASSGLRRARSFRGHTEWLEALDGAPYSVMCFASPRLISSLVTTHLPLSQVPRALTSQAVARSILELAELTLRLGIDRPHLAVCSLNPHAGEGELLGREEVTAIVPALEMAGRSLGRKVKLTGPVGAETAFRKAAAGSYDGVVAMYHDQATIPMKLLDFGGAVNVTQGLSIVRTSVDHGTAYDIAGTGKADPRGMLAAMSVAARLGSGSRRLAHGTW